MRAVLLALLALLTAAPAGAQTVSLSVPIDSLVARARRDSTDPLALYDLGIGAWVHGDFATAEKALRAADAIDPRVAEVQLALAYLPYAKRPKLWNEEAKGKVPPEWVASVNEADRRFRRAFLLDPLVDKRVIGLVVPPRDAIIIGRNADRYYAALVLGFEYFWGGNYGEAFVQLEKAYAFTSEKDLDRVPWVVLWYHGLSAAHIGNHAAALRDFELLLGRALEREKSDSVTRFAVLPSNSIRYVHAILLRRAGRTADATAEFQEVLSNDLSFEMAHAQLAEMAEQAHRWDEAIKERERAIEASPEDPGLLIDYGTTLARARRFRSADSVLVLAEAALPLNARVPYLRGQAAVADGRSAEAIDNFKRFAALAPARFGFEVKKLEAKYGPLR